MTSVLLGGILTLAPSILQTVVQCTKGVNPSNNKFSSLEKRVALGNYEHLEKKLTALNEFLKERSKIPKMMFSGDDESGYILDQTFFPEIHACSELLASRYEEFLEKRVYPIVLVEFFSNDYPDESLMYHHISKIPDFYHLDNSMLYASSLETAFAPYSINVINYHIGVNPALSTMLTKLVDDSILAFSRIAPNRIICPTSYFCTIPYDGEGWFLGFHYIRYQEINYSGKTVDMLLCFNDRLVEQMNKYKDVYEFEVQVWWDIHAEKRSWMSTKDEELYGGKMFLITGPEMNVKLEIPELSNNYQLKYNYKFYAKLKNRNVLASQVASLHGLNEADLTFGNLMSRGDYNLNDPIFSIRGIFDNTVSGAQFSIQTSFALLSAWLQVIQQEDASKYSRIKTRYSSMFSNIELEDLCSIDFRILRTKKLAGQQINGLSTLWERVINDLLFMKKHILRTKSGRLLVSKVVFTC